VTLPPAAIAAWIAAELPKVIDTDVSPAPIEESVPISTPLSQNFAEPPVAWPAVMAEDMLSPVLVAESEFATTVPPVGVMTGADGAAGAVRSTVMLAAATLDGGPTTPAADVAPPAANVGMTVPSEQPVTVTDSVLVDEPEVGDHVKTQPGALPAFVKSASEMLEASTLPLNASEYVRVDALVGEVTDVVKLVAEKISY
jgi:hypothetical protein